MAIIVFKPGDDSLGKKDKKTNKDLIAFFENSYLSTYKLEGNNLSLFSEKLVDKKIIHKVFLTKPNGTIGKGSITKFNGNSGVIDRNKNELLLNGEVLLIKEDSTIKSEKLKIDYSSDEALAFGNVHSQINGKLRKMNIWSQSVEMLKDKSLVLYRGQVSGDIKSNRGSAYDAIEFKSKLLTLNDKSKIIFLDGDAYIKRGRSTITSITGSIWLDNDTAGVKYFSMNDDVELLDGYEKPNGGFVYRKSFSEKLEGFAEEEKLILSGFPQVEQEGDIIKGNTMIIREDKEMIEIINTNSQFQLDGRKKK